MKIEDIIRKIERRLKEIQEYAEIKTFQYLLDAFQNEGVLMEDLRNARMKYGELNFLYNWILTNKEKDKK